MSGFNRKSICTVRKPENKNGSNAFSFCIFDPVCFASCLALPGIRPNCRRHLESVFSYRLSWNHRQQLQKRKRREEERIRRRLIHDSYKDLVHGVEAGGSEYKKYYKHDTKIGQIISYNLHHHCHRHCCLPENYFFSRSLHRPHHCRRAYPLDFR